MSRHSNDEPVYRPILREAFRIAWTEKRYWWVALLAGVTLTSSVYDVGWGTLNPVPMGTPGVGMWTAMWTRAMTVWPNMNFGELVLGGIKVFQLSVLFFVLVFAVWSLSLMAQGALVYAIGKKGARPGIREAWTVGARAFWPVLVLNLFVFLVLWSVQALLSIALTGALQNTTTLSYLGFILAFLAFVIVAAGAVMMHVFALNAMILQGATLMQALERAAHVISKHWVVAVETAAILFLITTVSTLLVVVLNMLIGLPMFFMALLSVLLQSKALMMLTIYTAVAIFVAITLAVAGFVIQLHYAAWSLLYRKLGEGGVLPKLHRWIRWLTHGYRVPGA